MATLRIPPEQESGFEKLIALDDESVRALAATLREEFPGFNNHDALSEIASRATGISLAEASEVMGVLAALYLLQARSEVSTSEFVEDVCQALDEADTEVLRLSGEARDHFKGRLTELLNIESVGVESKAVDVQHEAERTFHSARIMTDIRPVFGSSPESLPTGAVVVHTLRITYRERNRLKDLFVALDTEDVDTLEELADRANLKAKSLKAFLAGTPLSYIDLDRG